MEEKSVFKNEKSTFSHGETCSLDKSLSHCRLCPRRCGVNRFEQTGFCGAPAHIRAARAALHQWEEPCISGIHGSGTVFFSGCTLRCSFCQNYRISEEAFGKEISPRQLAGIFLRLQDQGAHNINLVTATQYLPLILPALDLVRHRLHIPIVYNCGGYERRETVRSLKDYVDIWLPDLKYFDSRLSRELSQAQDYFEAASQAIRQMIEQTGPLQFHTYREPIHKQPCQTDITGSGHALSCRSCRLMDRGVIIRHMVLPGHRDDSIRLLHWIADTLPKDRYLISIMSQYTPYRRDEKHPELNRRLTSYEYQKVVDTALALGITQGYIQQKSSAKEEYTPPFDLEGL